jgi:hypothetical protein
LRRADVGEEGVDTVFWDRIIERVVRPVKPAELFAADIAENVGAVDFSFTVQSVQLQQSQQALRISGSVMST